MSYHHRWAAALPHRRVAALEIHVLHLLNKTNGVRLAVQIVVTPYTMQTEMCVLLSGTEIISYFNKFIFFLHVM